MRTVRVHRRVAPLLTGAACAVLVGCAATPPAEPPNAPAAPIVELPPSPAAAAGRDEDQDDAEAQPSAQTVPAPSPFSPRGPVWPTTGDGPWTCSVEVMELTAGVLEGAGSSTTSAAEADRRAREHACDSSGRPPDRCLNEDAYMITSQSSRFSMVANNGKREQRYERTLRLREVGRRRVERATSADSPRAACRDAHANACSVLFGQSSCPSGSSTYRVVP